MSLINKLITKQRWSNISPHLEVLAKWNQWVLWDYQQTGNLELFSDYSTFRTWLQLELISFGLTADDLPVITSKNYMKIWFECDRLIDKESLKESDFKNIRFVVSRNKYKVLNLPKA